MISALLFGNFKSDNLKKRLMALKESDKLMCHIEESTILNQKSLGDIFRNIKSEDYSLKYIGLFNENLLMMNQPQAIEKAIFETDDFLNGNDRSFFCEFYKSLGKNDLEKEIEKIRIFRTKLCKRIDDAEKEYLKKGMLYRKLSALTGLLVAVFLI